MNLLLYNLLLLFFELVYEVMRQLQDNSDEAACDRLIHHVLELDFLAYQINCRTCLAKKPPIELQCVPHNTVVVKVGGRLSSEASDRTRNIIVNGSIVFDVPTFKLSEGSLLAKDATNISAG